MKRNVSRLLITMLLMSTISGIKIPTANAAIQDVYIHVHYNSDGNITDIITEKLGATDEDATHKAFYVVFHVLDHNNMPHQLWVSTVYTEKQDDGTWKITDMWFCGFQAILDFFEAHISN